MKNPQNKVVFDQIASKRIDIVVGHNANLTNATQMDYSDYTKYVIEITANKKSAFYIKPSRHTVSAKIIEGLPATIGIEKESTILIEFINNE